MKDIIKAQFFTKLGNHGANLIQFAKSIAGGDPLD